MSGTDLPASESDVVTREKVKVKSWLAKPDVVAHFECQEIDDNRKSFDRYLSTFQKVSKGSVDAPSAVAASWC